MQIAVPRENAAGERRVAIVPEVVAQLTRAGHRIRVEKGAGIRAGFTDKAYEDAGCQIARAADLYAGADMVLRVQRPEDGEVVKIATGTVLIGLLQPGADPSLFARLAGQGVIACSMELVPRTTRAQMMDALSSQSTVAGYKAVLIAANSLQKFFPMLMTAAGTVRPAKVLVIGAGVAGLQAIATARRIGAVVEAFDTRPVVKEQVKSLGATFVELDVVPEEAQDAGGYARELSEDHIRREKDLIHQRAIGADVIITTALVPGRRAPMLVSAETVRAMKPGSVIVDLAGEQGGNCELTRPGETVVENDVTIIAPLHISSDLAFHASQMYAKNVAALVTLMAPKGALELNFNDDIISAVCVTANGEVRHGPTRERLASASPMAGASR
ncbi:MAG TPA: Re/Si-specific NAD(P)(+) transhydrogenase subunit alpha [Gemmatimonadaceae bacterium]|nr:Re/Si-specific NAD(P)(+) transhydrogenase subunit alpha [Gemmatimonadaceae bacterium]